MVKTCPLAVGVLLANSGGQLEQAEAGYKQIIADHNGTGEGLDSNEDGVVNFLDFACIDDCCIET